MYFCAFYNRIFVCDFYASVEKPPESKDVLLLLFYFFVKFRPDKNIKLFIKERKDVYPIVYLSINLDIIKNI